MMSRILSAPDETEYYREGERLCCMMRFINSTSRIDKVLFSLDGSCVGLVDSQSVLRSDNCKFEIMKKNQEWLFECRGEIRVEMMDIRSIYKMGSIFECGSMGDWISYKMSSAVEVRDSLFKDVRIYESEGGFISYGGIEREIRNEE